MSRESGITLVLEVQITGETETAASWRESMAWCNANAHTPEAHEVMAVLAMQLARMHWRDADRIRAAAADREARAARRAAR